MSHAYLPYIITEIYCIIFAATVWFRLSSNLGTEHEVRQLRNMIYSYLGMLLMDILWGLSEDNLIHPPALLNACFSAVLIISISCGCYYWFRFIEDRLHFGKRSLDILLRIPLLVVCGLDVASIFTGWIFYIDASGHYQNTGNFLLPSLVNYFYLGVPTVLSVGRAVRARTRQERSEYRTYALYMVVPLIAGLLEDVFPLVPILALNIFMMVLILFLMIQNMQVYNDALTGLNNRGRLNWYLEECLPRASRQHPVVLFIIDINRFKFINDFYGHLEGDHALKIFAGMLGEVAADYDAFAARYGGDEFCIVTTGEKYDPEEVAAEIQRRLKEMPEQEVGGRQPYSMTASIGYAVCDQPESQMDAVLAQADKVLYENKKAWHCGNG